MRVETLAQALRLLFERRGAVIKLEAPRDFGGGALRSVNVALHFDERDRALGQFAIRMENRIVTVLPALVDQTFFRPATIFDKAVTIAIAVNVDPVERRLYLRPKRADSRDVI